MMKISFFRHFFEEKVPYQALKKAKNKGNFWEKFLFYIFFLVPVLCSYVCAQIFGVGAFFFPSGGAFLLFLASATRSSAMWEHRYRASVSRNSWEAETKSNKDGMCIIIDQMLPFSYYNLPSSGFL